MIKDLINKLVLFASYTQGLNEPRWCFVARSLLALGIFWSFLLLILVMLVIGAITVWQTGIAPPASFF